MIDRDAFLELARSIVGNTYPADLDLFPIEVPPLMEKLEAGARVDGKLTSRIEDQEFGLGDVFETVKFLAILVAAYKTILDIRDRRKKKSETGLKLSEEEVLSVLRKRLSDAKVDPEMAACVESKNGAALVVLANS